MTPVFGVMIAFTKASCIRIIIWGDDSQVRHLWTIRLSFSRGGYKSLELRKLGTKIEIEPP